MNALFKLVEQHRALSQLDADECTEEAIRDTLEGLKGDITQQAESVGQEIRNRKAIVAGRRAEAKRMSESADKEQKVIESLERFLLGSLKAAGMMKPLKFLPFTIAIRKNPPAVCILTGTKLEERFLVQHQPSPNLTAIRQAIQAGEIVPGCELTQAERLEIK